MKIRKRTHGGARAGAGRPRKHPKPKAIDIAPRSEAVAALLGGVAPTRTAPAAQPTELAAPFDAEATLREIAADPTTPATARVAACKALLAVRPPSDADRPTTPPSSDVDRRALEILNRGRLQ